MLSIGRLFDELGVRCSCVLYIALLCYSGTAFFVILEMLYIVVLSCLLRDLGVVRKVYLM